MITTKFGSEVKAVGRADSEGWLKCVRVSDQAEREFHLSDLRFDPPEEYDAVRPEAEST